VSLPTLRSALNAGELSPQLYGRTDLAKYAHGCSTLRNFFASYRGGALSRAGTLYVGQCKQGNKGAALTVAPPRDISFNFSVTQGIVIEAGDNYFRFVINGGYVTESASTITNVTSASPSVVTDVAHGYVNGDEVFLQGIGGIPQLNNRSFEVSNTTTNTFTLVDVLDGTTVSTLGQGPYTSGGTAERIYTLATPYAAADLPDLKWAQSADVMSLTCVNQATQAEYPPMDLARITDSNWTLTTTSFVASIGPPASISYVVNTSAGTPSFYYSFCGTAIDASTGEESIASPVAIAASVDISTQAGTITVNLATVANAGSYNFYGGPATYGAPPSAGILFGYIGTAFGPSFADTNVTPDFSTGPPLHSNPFATSSVTAVAVTSTGNASYSITATTATVTSPIGQNAALTPVVIGVGGALFGEIAWIVVDTAGAGYTGGEAVVISDGTGSGSGASATTSIGPATGTFPSVVSYFQQRRVYAATLNNPETYYMSQPGAFTNMDVSDPVVDSDAIIGTPWSQQVNGVLWMLNMPGGLVIFTGLGAWQVSGAGSGLATSAAITPADQVANPQAYNGCSPTVPPIPINYDIIYVQEKGSIVRDLSYNFFVNIYTGTDMTVLSNHLFDGFTIVQWGWAEEPNKLIWAVRNDGTLLCLTYLKEQDVYAWTRHDTNGLFQSVAVVSEPPVNAPYFIVQRLIQNNGNPVWAYFQERMDNRLWLDQEDAWCVDAGLSLPQNSPNATLTVSSASGVLTLQLGGQPGHVLYGGSNYSAGTYAEVLDTSGTGSGCIAAVTVSGGIVTTAAIGGNINGYSTPAFNIIDPTGAGGNAAVEIYSVPLTTVTASAPVFANAPGQGEPGDVIRMNGRTMTVQQFVNSTTLIAEVTRDAAPSIPNDPLNTAVPVGAGGWTITAPVLTVYGLNHLEGNQVSILADGVVVAPQKVVNGTVSLPQPASQVVVGLGFTCQLQTLYLDIPGPATVQGRRKLIDSAVVRLAGSGFPFEIGANQPDAATQPGQVNVPWTNLSGLQQPPNSLSPQQPFELFSGDVFSDVVDAWNQPGGQIAVQQTAPIPLNLLSIVTSIRLGDDVDSE
jgi:hypothetical protein